jgi:hypothetical protein
VDVIWSKFLFRLVKKKTIELKPIIYKSQINLSGVTVHFVIDWTLKSFILALKHLEKQHTAENLLSELRQVISKWGLSQKVMTVSADGAYNIKSVSYFVRFRFNGIIK